MSSEKQCGRKNLMLPEIVDGPSSDYHRSSSVCKTAFFKSFSMKASGVVIHLNRHGEKFLKTHLVSRLQKCSIFFRKGLKLKEKQVILKHGPKSLTSADPSTKAMVKIFRKYNKVKGSRKDLKSRTEFRHVQLEDLKPPCLCELVAFENNLKERKPQTTFSGLFDECKLQINEERSFLSISLSNSRDIAVDLNCSICLDTVFDPVSLTCGHIFCYMCACSAGSTTTFDGIKAADSTSKCPLCRKEGVFRDAVRMSQLQLLLKRKFPEYWKERRKKESQARVKEAKDYWDLQCRAFVGIE